MLRKLSTPKCENCSIKERRLALDFDDPERDYLASELVLRYVINEEGIEQLEATLHPTDAIVIPYEGAPDEPKVPYGTYIMIKQ